MAQWIASCRAIPANPTVSPAEASELRTIDGYSTVSSTSSTPAGLVVSGGKTSRGMRTDSSGCSFRHWKGWVAALRSEYSARKNSALPTDASGCSLWPTATASMAEKGSANQSATGGTDPLTPVAIRWTAPDWRTPNAKMAEHGPMSPEYRHSAGQTISLDDQATHWRTPQAGDSTRGAKSQRGASSTYRDRAGRHSLVTEASAWMTPQTVDAGRARAPRPKTGHPRDLENEGNWRADLKDQASVWPTPMTRDHRSGHSQKSDEDLWGKKGKPLERVATTHSSALDPAIPAGPTSSPERRTLNPLFVEWLMGWPIGWTGSGPVETASSHWWQAMRGELSRLVSRPTPDRLL